MDDRIAESAPPSFLGDSVLKAMQRAVARAAFEHSILGYSVPYCDSGDPTVKWSKPFDLPPELDAMRQELFHRK